jgi:hypothetical protein
MIGSRLTAVNPTNSKENVERILRMRVAGVDPINNVGILAFDDTDFEFTDSPPFPEVINPGTKLPYTLERLLMLQSLPFAATNIDALDNFEPGGVVIAASRSMRLQNPDMVRGIISTMTEYVPGVPFALHKFSGNLSPDGSGGPIVIQTKTRGTPVSGRPFALADDIPYIVTIAQYWIRGRIYGIYWDSLSASSSYIMNRWPAILKQTRSSKQTTDPTSTAKIIALNSGVGDNPDSIFPTPISVAKVDLSGIFEMVNACDRWATIFTQRDSLWHVDRAHPWLSDRRLRLTRGNSAGMRLKSKNRQAFDFQNSVTGQIVSIEINDVVIRANVEIYDTVTNDLLQNQVEFGHGPDQVDIWFLHTIIANNPPKENNPSWKPNKINSLEYRKWNSQDNTLGDIITIQMNVTATPSFFTLETPNLTYFEVGADKESKTSQIVPRNFPFINQWLPRPKTLNRYMDYAPTIALQPYGFEDQTLGLL